MVENTFVTISASVFGGFVPVFGGDFAVGGLVFSWDFVVGVGCFFLFSFVFVLSLAVMVGIGWLFLC